MAHNYIMLIGRLGKDVDLRTGKNGGSVANISLATEHRFKDRDGEWQKKTEWHKCVAFGKVADTLEKHLRKGSKVGFQGRLQYNSWEKDGVKRTEAQVAISDVLWLEAPNKSESSGRDTGTSGGGSFDDGFEDDIPF